MGGHINKITQFKVGNKLVAIRYIETQTIKEGVECDIYAFADDGSKDLAIVRVQKGYKTPLQKVLLGDVTIEGFVSGAGTLTVDSETYEFGPGLNNAEVVVKIGQKMQWLANGDSDFTFYEICEPPYSEGRFENLSE